MLGDPSISPWTECAHGPCAVDRPRHERIVRFRAPNLAALRVEAVDVDGRACVDAQLRRWGTWGAVVLDGRAAATTQPITLRASHADGADGALFSVATINPGDTPVPRPPPDRPFRLPDGRERDPGLYEREPIVLPDLHRQLHLAVVDSIAWAPPELGSSAWMWWYLDANTHPRLLGDTALASRFPWRAQSTERAFRSEAVDAIYAWLEARAAARQGFAVARGTSIAALRGELRGLTVKACEAPERWLGHILAVTEGVLSPWLPTIARDAATQEPLAWACRAFACGLLHLVVDHEPMVLEHPIPQGQPDSASIVLFAELALAAIEFDIRPTWWSAALRPFVAMLPLFREAYGCPHAPLSPSDYVERVTRPPRPLDMIASARAVDRALSLDDDALELELGVRLKEMFDRPITLPSRKP